MVDLRRTPDGRRRPGVRSGTSEHLPPLRYALAARAEAEARTTGSWSLRHLRICWAALGTVQVLLAVVAAIAVGGRAVIGVIIGGVIVGAFFTVSALVIAWVGARFPSKVMWAALGTYVLKVLALGFVLVLTPRDGAFDSRWMASAVGLGLAVWLAAHTRFVWTNKIFYVDPR